MPVCNDFIERKRKQRKGHQTITSAPSLFMIFVRCFGNRSVMECSPAFSAPPGKVNHGERRPLKPRPAARPDISSDESESSLFGASNHEGNSTKLASGSFRKVMQESRVCLSTTDVITTLDDTLFLVPTLS
jgi:hypothetical protein